MRAEYKFLKVAGDADARDVQKGGRIIGRIHFTWTALGGWGWNNRLFGKTYRAMRDAAKEIERIRGPGETGAADDAYHLLQDAAEALKAAGLPEKADAVYRLIETLAGDA